MNNSPIRVLLINNNENGYILTRDWFSGFDWDNYELEWAHAYDVGRNAIAHNNHHVYLVNYNLGSHNGIELLSEGFAIGCTSPMILLTNHPTDREIDIKAIKAGAADVLEIEELTPPLLERSILYALERQLTLEKIRQQAALLDVTTDAIFMHNLDNLVLFWNQAAEKLYGWKKQEAIDRNTQELWQEKNKALLKTAFEELMKNGSWEGELYQITKSGKNIIVHSRWSLVKNFSDTLESILVVNTDITQKKQLEAQFLRAQRLESIGTLASGIAHDLNNVLSPIMMTAQLLESQLNDERACRLLPILISNAKRAANLVNQVLSFTRGVEGERTIIKVKHIINEIKQVISETFPKSIEVSTKIAPNLWFIWGDSTQLHQVLMNLCVNARDAMANGGRLQIEAENLVVDQNYAQMNIDAQVGSYVVITVSDTGTGIAPEILDRVFEPFFTTKQQGTGLGLSTVMGITKNHGGFVHLYSELGRGSEFKVYLPAQRMKETPEEAAPSLPQGNGELILIVDDEEHIREVTKTSLENYNYRVISASDGIEAIALYAEHRHHICLVLTDMLMPSMDGMTTIQTLKKINSKVKIIAISGLTTADQVSAAYNLGIKAFLSKPYTTSKLLQTINLVKAQD